MIATFSFDKKFPKKKKKKKISLAQPSLALLS
jgi:hypothetical protein